MSCPDCFQGHVHAGEPRGKISKLYGLDIYISEPSDGPPAKGIVVVLPDAFGWDFPNTRLLADRYADKGPFKVYLPDFMNGHSAPPAMLAATRAFTSANVLAKPYHLIGALYHFIPWIRRNSIAKVWPHVKTFFTELRAAEGGPSGLPIGAAGFCWGGKLAVLLAAEDGAGTPDGCPLVDAVFAGHPSWIKVPDDISRIARPLSIAVGDRDSQLTAVQAEQIRGTVEAFPEDRKGEVTIYAGCGHGFCVRADVSFKDSEIASQAARAEEQAIAWFDRHFGMKA